MSEYSLNIHSLSIDDAYTKLDHEIYQLKIRLSAVRTLRNTLPPISRIPIELIAKIFSHTQEHIGPPFHGDFDTTTRFFVSWVCRHWRKIAIATPSLWTVISNKSNDIPLDFDFVEALLSRSGKRGLSIDLHAAQVDVSRVCLSQMSRVQHLRLPSLLPNADLGLLFQPAPLLISLDLDFHCPNGLFSGVYPQLCHVTVSNAVVHPASPFITPTLTNLRIIRPVGPLEVNDLIGILIGLPQLVELSLEGSFISQTVAGPVERVALPSLQIVSMMYQFMQAELDLLAFLDIPHVAVTLTWSEEANISEDGLRFFSTMFHNYQTQISFQIHHLDIRYRHGVSFNISSSPTEHRYSFRFPEHNLIFSQIDAAFSSLVLDNLQTLSTETLSPEMATKLSKLTNLKSITLRGNGAFVTFIVRGGLQAPALEELIICEVRQPVGSVRMHEFREDLKSRHHRGYPLQRMVLVKSSGLSAELLREFVGTLSVVD